MAAARIMAGIVVLVLSFALSLQPVHALQTAAQQVSALLSFKQSADPTGTVLSSWSSSNANAVCKWAGVYCDRSSYVTKLIITGQPKLSGTISGQLSTIASLTLIELIANRLSGTVPSQLSSLARLQKLDLTLNRLSGPIPTFNTGAYPSLVTLTLQQNAFTGTIPSSLSLLSRLTELNLANTGLSGSVPLQLTSLTHLQKLVLSQNNLAGTLPYRLSKFTSLTQLNLEQNFLKTESPSLLQYMCNVLFANLTLNCFNPNLVTKCIYAVPQHSETECRNRGVSLY